MILKRKTQQTLTSLSHTSIFYFEFHNGVRLHTKFQFKRDDFKFLIVKFPFIGSNIPPVSAYCLYIFKVIRFSRTCVQHRDVLDISRLLTFKRLRQGYVTPRLMLSLMKFYACRLVKNIRFTDRDGPLQVKLQSKQKNRLSAFSAWR